MKSCRICLLQAKIQKNRQVLKLQITFFLSQFLHSLLNVIITWCMFIVKVYFFVGFVEFGAFAINPGLILRRGQLLILLLTQPLLPLLLLLLQPIMKRIHTLDWIFFFNPSFVLLPTDHSRTKCNLVYGSLSHKYKLLRTLNYTFENGCILYKHTTWRMLITWSAHGE